MERTTGAGAGMRQKYLPQEYSETLQPRITGSAHWSEGAHRSRKWDYAPNEVNQPIMPPNHIRGAEWFKQSEKDALGIQASLRQRGFMGDSLNVDSFLLDRPDVVNMPVQFDQGSTLHVAAMRGHSDLARVLIHRGADTNYANHAGQTSLHTACESNQATVVMELLAAGADADQKDAMGQTALHRAAYTGSTDALLALLEYGANSLLQDHGGLLAIHKAASMGRAQALDLLLQRDPGAASREAANGWTALHLAAHGGHALACEVLVAHGADVNAPDDERIYALHRAAIAGSGATCEVLVRSGAELAAYDKSRNTPLHAACEAGSVEASWMLLRAGAPVLAVNSLRRTPLHEAAETGNVELCSLLLQYGADPTAADMSKGVPTPAAVARRHRHFDLVALLEAASAAVVAAPAQPATVDGSA